MLAAWTAFLLGTIFVATAAEIPGVAMPPTRAGQFQHIEQSLGRKIAVTAGGFGLIGIELWWFLLHKPKPQPASIQKNIQEVPVD
jgi:plastocyanin domain-containing protein